MDSNSNNAFLSERATLTDSAFSNKWSTSTIIFAGTLAENLKSVEIEICFLANLALSVVVAVKTPSAASKLIAVKIGLCSFKEAAKAVWDTKDENSTLVRLIWIPFGSKSISGYSFALIQFKLYYTI